MMVATEVPDIVGDSTAVIGLTMAAIALLTTILGLLWKVFKTHSLLLAVVAEMKPNHGSSLRDAMDATRVMTEDNGAQIAKLAQVHQESDAANAAAHSAIHRRIDGLFELIAGPAVNQPRKVAEWHRTQRERNAEEES